MLVSNQKKDGIINEDRTFASAVDVGIPFVAVFAGACVASLTLFAVAVRALAEVGALCAMANDLPVQP